MNYEELLGNDYFKEKAECNCYSYVKLTLLVVTLLTLAVDCVSHCRTRSRVRKLTAENETMRSLIMTSLDKAFTKIVKNGYDSESEHED